jgi:hypothetical protein
MFYRSFGTSSDSNAVSHLYNMTGLLGPFNADETSFFRDRNMTQAFCKTTINLPADTVWQVLSDSGAAGQYLTGVVNCMVEGEGVGAQRTLTSADGSRIVERLETLDEATHQVSYALLTDTPFRNCLTTMAVRELAPSLTELEWTATFEADGLPADEAREMLEGALAANCLALKQFLER